MSTYNENMSDREIAEGILSAQSVSELVAFARGVPIQRILVSLDVEQVDSIVAQYQLDEEFVSFVEEKSRELSAAYSQSDKDYFPEKNPAFDMTQLLQINNLDAFLSYLDGVDIGLVARSLLPEEVDTIMGRFGSEARFQNFLVEQGVVPAPVPANYHASAPIYDSRFANEKDAIAYAEANGQGPLAVLQDGTIVNQYGETMVYDSDGNLAPASREIPVGMILDPNDPFGGFIEDLYLISPAKTTVDPASLLAATSVDDLLAQLEGADIGAVAASLGPAEIDLIMGRFGGEALFQNFLVEKGVVPAPQSPIYDVPAPIYDSRFAYEKDAIAYAEANGQGQLAVLQDGTIVNQYGETMVYDSDGNLAPASREIPVGMIPDPYDPFGGFIEDPHWVPPAIPVVDPSMLLAATNVDELLAQLENADIGAVAASLGPAEIDAIMGRFGAEARFQNFLFEKGVVPAPAPPIYDAPAPIYDSRFATEEDAFVYAEANGQGELTYLDDGTIVNRYGETMVYDSSGNLAPAPRELPVGMISNPEESFGGFIPDPNWIEPTWNEPPEQVDSDGHFAPTPVLPPETGWIPYEPPMEWYPDPAPSEPPMEWMPETFYPEPPVEWYPEPLQYDPAQYDPFIAY